MPPHVTRAAVLSALELGYRFIDTAQNYLNEEEVGQGVRDFLSTSGNPREAVFVSTKLHPDSHKFSDALAAGRASCEVLGLGYIDRLIIHTPRSGKLVEAYDALLELKEQGVVRSIGVSNFDIPHLDALEYYERPPPAVNQIEMHPFVFKERRELVERCRAAGIQVEAFCPLVNGAAEVLSYGTLPEMAAHIGRTPAQVLLRWAVQHGFVVIPKSSQPERQAENMRIFDFDLTQEQLSVIDSSVGFNGLKRLLMYPDALQCNVEVGRTSARAFAAPGLAK